MACLLKLTMRTKFTCVAHLIRVVALAVTIQLNYLLLELYNFIPVIFGK